MTGGEGASCTQNGTRADELRGAGLARTFSPKAETCPVRGAQQTLGSSSRLSTWVPRPALTKVVEVLEHCVQEPRRAGRGGPQPLL